MACQLSAGLGIKRPKSRAPWEDGLPGQPAPKPCLGPALRLGPALAVCCGRTVPPAPWRCSAAARGSPPSQRGPAPPRAPPGGCPAPPRPPRAGAPPSHGAPQRQPPLAAGTEEGSGPAARPGTWVPSFPRAKQARKEAFSNRVPLLYFGKAKTLPCRWP